MRLMVEGHSPASEDHLDPGVLVASRLQQSVVRLDRPGEELLRQQGAVIGRSAFVADHRDLSRPTGGRQHGRAAMGGDAAADDDGALRPHSSITT